MRSKSSKKMGTLIIATATWFAVTLACASPSDNATDMAEVASVQSQGPPGLLASPTSEETSIFTDVTAQAGIDFVHQVLDDEVFPLGPGALVLDFDGNGLDDIYVPNSDGPNALYRNNGDGTFTEMASAAGVADPLGRGSGGCAADYDNDGDQDLYVSGYGTSKLFRNRGDGTFADVTHAAGVQDPDLTYRSAGCAWGDYDQDGHLDFVVVRHLDEQGAYLSEILGNMATAVRSLALFHNDRDGTFTNTSHLLGDTSGPNAGKSGEALGNIWGSGFQPGWVDFDNDGDLDLYTVNDFGQYVQPNVLWRNEEGFLDVSGGSGADLPIDGMGLAVGDYDLDGFLDLFMTNIGRNVLLRNSGDGLKFTDTAIEAGVGIGEIEGERRVSWGAVFFDYDNDGDEDLYVVSGMLLLRGPTEQRNVLLRNRGDGTFVDVSLASGADDPGVGRGGVYLDFNNDGCVDLFVSNLGQGARLFENMCVSGNNWLVVKTVGTTSNREGIGARITVEAGDTTQIREISSGRSSLGQNMLGAHFGLGSATVVDTVSIRWPSGEVQTLTGVPVNQRLAVTEPR